MSDSPLQAFQDSTDLDYTTFTSDYRIYRYVFLACLVIVIYDHLLTLSTEETLIEATLSIRVFAMYGRNIWVLIPLLALACIIMPLAVVGIVKAGPAQNLAAPGLNGCNTPYPRVT
ncbi:hypothetical protein MVEN_00163200 [Mycena venus]|uniref:DUF6533 domain-containing protein n=1 Tax=Mycena venus TaxID=2733690 RepID=A0A8H6YXR5_9AGAR|nr:hypothetical protein MVEN_00163200 [Mycena venus]